MLHNMSEINHQKKFKKQHNAFIRGIEGQIKQGEQANIRISNMRDSQLSHKKLGRDSKSKFESPKGLHV